MLEDLSDLIIKIQSTYNDISDRWMNNTNYKKYNLAKKQVRQIYECGLIQTIKDYKAFLTDNLISFNLELISWSASGVKINTRIKNQNSIEYKIQNYIKNNENGTTRVNKCLNDLFGARIILKNNYSIAEIRDFVKEKFPDLKCIDSKKQEYTAVHIYFKSTNYTFQWELQVWTEYNEKNNLKSHKKYKEEYALWEKRAKEGK